MQLALGAKAAWLCSLTLEQPVLKKNPELALVADLLLRGLLVTMAWRAQSQRRSHEGAAPSPQCQRGSKVHVYMGRGWGLLMAADAILIAL